jgi:hypothetical protein
MLRGHQLMPCSVIIDLYSEIPRVKSQKMFLDCTRYANVFRVDQIIKLRIRAKMLNDGKKVQDEGNRREDSFL